MVDCCLQKPLGFYSHAKVSNITSSCKRLLPDLFMFAVSAHVVIRLVVNNAVANPVLLSTTAHIFSADIKTPL